MTVPARGRHGRDVRRVPRRRPPTRPFRERHAVLPRKLKKMKPQKKVAFRRQEFRITAQRLLERAGEEGKKGKQTMGVGPFEVQILWAIAAVSDHFNKGGEPDGWIVLKDDPGRDPEDRKKKKVGADKAVEMIDAVTKEYNVLADEFNKKSTSIKRKKRILKRIGKLAKTMERAGGLLRSYIFE